MQPIPQTTLNSSSLPVHTQTIAVNNGTETEAAQKAATEERLLQLIQEARLEVMYSKEAYLELDINDTDRNAVNDFVILKKIPEANSKDQFDVISNLAQNKKSAIKHLLNHIIKTNGTDEIKLFAVNRNSINALEFLLTENPLITKTDVTICSSRLSGLGDTLRKFENLQEVGLNFPEPRDQKETLKSLTQLVDKNNLQKFSIILGREFVGIYDGDPPPSGKFELHKIIDANRNLNSLEIEGEIQSDEIDPLFKSIKNLNNLASLKFGREMDASPEFSEGLPDTIAACASLTNLEIKEYTSSDADQEALIDSIANHKNIRHLKIGIDPNPEFFSTPEDHQKLRDAFIEHPSLISLDLSEYNLDTTQVNILLSGDPGKCTLHSLKFSTSYVDKNNAKIIADFLKKASRLEEVSIEADGIDIEDFYMISDAIRQNPYLTKFDFQAFALDDDQLLEIDIIHAEQIQPVLDNNLHRLTELAMRDKWGSSFGAFANNVPATAIPANVAGLIAQHLARTEHANEPLGAAQRTDQTMLEMLLAKDAVARAEQKATPVPPKPNPATSPDSSSSSPSSSSSSASATGTGNSEQPNT